METVEAAFEPKHTVINVPVLPGSGSFMLTKGGWKRFTVNGKLGVDLIANQERALYTNGNLAPRVTGLSKVIPITRSANPIFAALRITMDGVVYLTPYTAVPATYNIYIDEIYF